MYKLVALDIDGTTANSKGRVSKRNVEVIKKVIDMGVPVCIVTGRNVRNTRRIIKQLGTKTPFICADGSVMFDPVENKVIYEKAFGKEQLREMLDIVNKHDVYVEMSSSKHYYQYFKRKELGKYNYGGSPNTMAGKLSRMIKHGVRFIKNIDRFLDSGDNVHQFIFIGEPENVEKAKQDIINKGYDNIVIRDNLWKGFVFVVNKNCTKTDGVKLLCNHYGHDISQVIAIGDELNDIDMIGNVGLGIAVENANERIKEVAKFITHSNDNDGVAHALEKFIINKETV